MELGSQGRSGRQQAVGMGRPSSQVGLLWTALVKAKDHCDGQTVEQRQKKDLPGGQARGQQ